MPIVIVGVVAALGVGVLTGFIWGPVQAIAQGLALIADNIVNMLPEAADLGLDASGGWVKGYAMLNTFLPITEALAFAAMFATVIAASMVVRVATWIWHLIPKPGVGT